MKVIVHNSVSLDGSLLGFAVDMEAHYRIAGRFKADVHLVGSNTAVAGLKMFYRKLPRERDADFTRPKVNRKLPLWVVPDTSGKLRGKLHVLRRSRLCRDIVILTAASTPKEYLRYLTARNYNWHCLGRRPLDYSRAIALLKREYGSRVILTDSGRTLNGILLNDGLVDEISLLIHPAIVGKGGFPMFSAVGAGIPLKLLGSRFCAGKAWLHFQALNSRKRR